LKAATGVLCRRRTTADDDDRTGLTAATAGTILARISQLVSASMVLRNLSASARSLAAVMAAASLVAMARGGAVPDVSASGLDGIRVVNSINSFDLIFGNTGDNVGFLPFIDLGEPHAAEPEN